MSQYGAPADIPSGFTHIFDGLTWLHGLSILGIYTLVFLLGYALLRPLLKTWPGHWLTHIFACFPFGYIVTVGIIRMISFALPIGLIAPVCVSIMIAITSGLFILNPPTKTQLSTWPSRAEFLFFIFVLGFIPIVNIYFRTNYWFGDYVDYGEVIKRFLAQPFQSFLPIFSTHYDFTIFHSSLLYKFESTLDPIPFVSLTLSLHKVAVALIFFIAFLKLGVSELFSILYTLFIFFGSYNLDSSNYWMLYDAFHPAFATVNGTRVIGYGISTLFVLAAYFGEIQKLPLLFFFLFGISLPAFPSHNLVYFTFYMVSAVSIRHLIPSQRERLRNFIRVLRSPSFIIALLVLTIFPFLTYQFRDPIPGLYVFISSVIGMILTTILIWCLRSQLGECMRSLWIEPMRTRLILFLTSAFVSTKFFGNLFAVSTLTRILDFFHSRGILTHLFIAEQVGRDRLIPSGRGRYFFSNATCCDGLIFKPFAEYDKGGLYFLGFWGFVFIVSFMAVASLRKCILASTEPRKTSAHLFWLIQGLFALTFFSLSLFYADFVNDIPALNWVKTRLLEIPIAMMWIVVFYSVSQYKDRFITVATTALCLIHIGLPLQRYHVIEQFVYNCQFLWNLIKS